MNSGVRNRYYYSNYSSNYCVVRYYSDLSDHSKVVIEYMEGPATEEQKQAIEQVDKLQRDYEVKTHIL